jgi:hypothetical protein
MLRALLLRDFEGTITDKGRIVELIVFPASFLVIWGALFKSGLLPSETAGELLVINLVWTTSNAFQAQTNAPLMFDLWSREFSELLREGVSMDRYMLIQVLFGTVVGLLHLAIFLLVTPLLFGASLQRLTPLVSCFPIYYAASIGLAYGVAAMVVRYGRSYGFLMWTSLQILIMCSSPYAPLESNPVIVRLIAYLSPFTFLFEYIRKGDAFLWVAGFLEGLLFVGLGILWYRKNFKDAKRLGVLVS